MSEHNFPPHATDAVLPTRQCHTIIEPRDDRADLITVYSTAPEDSKLTTWLSATADSCERLEEMR
ncbi:MAG: hypothetical protein J07HN6_02044 [Halonotius sp. J07HN6]|nr:MAG: hypothetical protein J07HN6_02044 [Halonotius sp. J07HN6]